MLWSPPDSHHQIVPVDLRDSCQSFHFSAPHCWAPEANSNSPSDDHVIPLPFSTLFSKLLPNSSFHALIILVKVHQGLLFVYRVKLRFHDLTSATSPVFSLATLLARHAPRFSVLQALLLLPAPACAVGEPFWASVTLVPMRLSAGLDPDSRVSHVIQNNSSSVGKSEN